MLCAQATRCKEDITNRQSVTQSATQSTTLMRPYGTQERHHPGMSCGSVVVCPFTHGCMQ